MTIMKITTVLLGCLLFHCSAGSVGAYSPDGVDNVDNVTDAQSPADSASNTTVGSTTSGPFGFYTTYSALDVPWWTPVTAAGPGEPVRLSPDRGKGFGQGQGSLAYPVISPNGKTVVIAFYPDNGGCVLYALRTDGSTQETPIALANAPDYHALDRDISESHFAYVSGDSLYVVPLDGSGFNNPTLVATVTSDLRIETPQWVKDRFRVTFRTSPVSGGSFKVYSAAADGSDVTSPIPLIVEGSPGNWVPGSLPGGKVVVRGTSDRLFVMSAEGGPAVPISPQGRLATLEGISDDGARVALELRTKNNSDRELVSVRTDGSDAESPVFLTVTSVGTLTSVASESGGRIAWVIPEDGGKWGIYETSFADPSGAPGQLIAPLHAEKLHLTDYSLAAQAVVVSTDSGAVYVAKTHGDKDQPLQHIYKVPEITNHIIPWPKFSQDGSLLLFSANTPDGWKAWVAPVNGGAASEVSPPWYADLITPFGIIFSKPTLRGAAFKQNFTGGAPIQLTPTHDAKVGSPWLDPTGTWLMYASDAPQPGWYASRTDGSMATTPHLVLPHAPPTPYPSEPKPPVVAKDYIVTLNNGELKAWPLSPSAKPKVLVAEGGTLFTVDPKTQTVLAAVGDKVLAITPPVTETGEWGEPVVVLTEPPTIQGIFPMGDGERVGVLSQGSFGTRMVVANVSGQDAQTPWVVSEGVVGWPMGAAVSPKGDRIVVVYSVMPTAVPHPDLVLVSDIISTPNTHRVVPGGFVPWGMVGCCDVWFQPTDPQFMTPDGVWGTFGGPQGLYSAKLDGTHATDPVFLGSATLNVGAGVGPDPYQMLTTDNEGLYLTTVGAENSQQALITKLQSPIKSARWIEGGAKVLVYTDFDWTKPQGMLFRVSTKPAGRAEVWLEETHRVTALGDFVPNSPNGDLIMQAAAGGDRSLYRVNTLGEKATITPWTQVDDTAETWIGVR